MAWAGGGGTCRDNKYVVPKSHAALGAVASGTRFTGGFARHHVFEPGPKGTVVIENTYGDPAYVAGQFGKGRVVFGGTYYGHERPVVGTEREIVFALLDWLTEAKARR